LLLLFAAVARGCRSCCLSLFALLMWLLLLLLPVPVAAMW